jgi:hypothetical protein
MPQDDRIAQLVASLRRDISHAEWRLIVLALARLAEHPGIAPADRRAADALAARLSLGRAEP